MRGSRPHNPKADYIVKDNIYFYKESVSGYYLGNVPIPGRKRRYPMRLHIYVWQKHNGDVPKGYQVHHIDGNKDNNDISNLELLKSFDHLSLHATNRSEASREHMLTHVIPAAAEWHKSEEAKQFHKDHFEQYTRSIWEAPVVKVCQFCGNEYTVMHSCASHSKFCSNKCKAAARRSRNADMLPYKCPSCGKEYLKSKYSKAVLCYDCNLVKLAESRRKK